MLPHIACVGYCGIGCMGIMLINYRHAKTEFNSSLAPLIHKVRAILRKIRNTIRDAAPGAQETISYGMPAFRMKRMLVYFAAFQHHIGLYPPVRGDAKLEQAVAPYAGEKGNLRFALDQAIPYALIARVVRFRVGRDEVGK